MADRLGVTGRIVSVNVGRPREVDRQGRPAQTAIWKAPVTGPVRATGVNLAGDDQADRQAHGGYDKAVYAYADEDRGWWERELGRSVDAGGFGENLTTTGIDLNGALVGEQWQVGSVRLEVSEPRLPCWKLNLRMEDRRFIQQFNAAARPGAYLRIVEEGVLEAGDEIAVVSTPDHDLTVRDVAQLYQSKGDVARILRVDQMSDAWLAWALGVMERRGEVPTPGCG